MLLDLNADKLKEECGVFGIFDHVDASALTALGLHSLQHRGQESCGIVSYDGKNYFSERRLGLVGDNFTKETTIEKLPGNFAIGHNRYSTTGAPVLRNIQPFFADLYTGGISIAHNGNLTNSIVLREKMIKDGAIFQTTSDTETIVQLIARSKRLKTIDKIIDSLFQIQGGYALVMLTNKKLIGVRDPYGIRPLVLGKLKKSYVLASETCALDIIGATFIREIENGEIVIITNDGVESIKPFKIPFELGLIRNHYVGRTFIEPTQQIRQLGVKLKHNPNSSLVKNKRIILIDDSIVRGTTSKKIVQMMYDAGAKEVHMRISCPPIMYPDYYGIDTPDKDQLLASNMSLDEMTKYIGVKTLKFLSIDGIYKAMGYQKRNNASPEFTDHYFTGDYPIPPLDQSNRSVKDNQLSLLSNIR